LAGSNCISGVAVIDSSVEQYVYISHAFAADYVTGVVSSDQVYAWGVQESCLG